MFIRLHQRILITLAAMVMVTAASAFYVIACPFCSAINMTFADQMKSNDIVVVARLLEVPDPIDDPDAELPKAKFEITNVLKGQEFVEKGMEFRSLLVGRYPTGMNFLVMGVDPPRVAWSTPMKANDRVVKYLDDIQTLPEKGADRLVFFQKYFEDEESVLAFDAYDEFAKAPYEDIIALKDRMERGKLVRWIKDPETSINRRRLYLTMLGVCGKSDDIKMLEEFLKSGDRKKQAGLDAMIGCYLTLKGEDGLKLIEDTFLRDTDMEYVDTLAAVSALRFHGTETDKIPQEKIVSAVRLLLDRPQMADMIIPDLARWKDWSVMEKLVKMFKDANEETSWLRVPVISYLRACPKPKAKEYIAELKKIDSDAVRRADFFLDFEDDEDDEDDGWGDEDDDADEEKTDGESSTKEPAESKAGGDKQLLTSTRADQENSRILLKKPMLVSDSDVDASEMNSTPVTDVPNNRSESVTNAATAAQVAPAIGDTVAATAPTVATSITPAAQAVPLIATWKIVFFPMLISVAIFILLWSVINGWFERLIY